MELKCSVQKYAWGKVGDTSKVAQLASKACDNFELDQDAPYAELWMGTHPSGPSLLADSKESLAALLASNPDNLGEKVVERFGPQLPFLFKVLSVNKALSIQAHPDKEHAEQLHRDRPAIYKDPNHKPEIAVALTEFEGLCGFRPLAEIQQNLATIPELKAAVTAAAADSLWAADAENYETPLRDCFTALMNCSKEVLSAQLSALSQRLSSAADPPPPSSQAELLCRLYSQYPDDVGCFVIYFLNHIVLQPGEAMFLGPNVPHAYLAGDCVECMANSDNVVRAGLTPKLIDVPTLVAMLEYRCGPPDDRKFSPEVSREDGSLLEYDPPVPDFTVARLEVPGDADCYSVPRRDSASIFLVAEGGGKYLASHQVTKEGGLTVVQPYASADMGRGTVLFLPADKVLELFPEDCQKLVAFQAFCKL